MSLRLPRLGDAWDAPFPPPESALRDPDGLLAFGGDLHPQRLLRAYAKGIFPWYSRGEPILWWSPDPRTVFPTAQFRLASRARRALRRSGWRATADRGFDAVVACCATTPRPGQRGTWITPEMRRAYGELHRLGHAHSIEVRDGERVVGGIYGVVAGAVFCGESMYSAEPGASKLALALLCRQLAAWGIGLLDAQVSNPHLESLGATTLARADYVRQLAQPTPPAAAPGSWTERFGSPAAAELA